MRIGYFTNPPWQGITAGTARSGSAGKFERELDLLSVTIRAGQYCQVIEMPEIGAYVAAQHRTPSIEVGFHPASKPWKGMVLAHDDPRAWEGTVAFTVRPTVTAVRAHLARCYSEGLLWDDVPVLWLFADGPRVHWERAASLLPYKEALSDWMMQPAHSNRIAA